jgi:tRNA modification GTPase
MLNLDLQSTICAIASGQKGAVRGVVRVTGSDSLEIVGRVCSIPEIPKRSVRIGSTISLDRLGTVGVDLFCWPDHRSYTGQPSVEIHTLGSPIVLHAIVQACLNCGAQPAQPGEFTLRGFLAGRLDLTQCEAVLGVIHANNAQELDVALKQLAGGLAEPLRELRLELIHLVADIEAGLDFVDEDITFIATAEVFHRLSCARDHVNRLLHQIDSRSAQRKEIQIAIVGLPNAGKSSLLNAITSSHASIVSHLPGTTRDFVRYRWHTQQGTIDLLDTAGLEEVEDESPRHLAQSVTRNQIDEADLILWCVPSGTPAIERPFIARKTQEVWLIRTKCDLFDSKAGEESPDGAGALSAKVVHVSSTTLVGIHEMRSQIALWLQRRNSESVESLPMTAERCAGALERAKSAIEAAMQATAEHVGDEIIAAEIRIALDELGQVAGVVYTDDVLDALFSRFCIGK